MKVISPSNQIPVMTAVIMSQHRIIRNSQMLILVYECKGLRPFFLVALIFKWFGSGDGESSYTQISGEVIDRLPEKSRGFNLP